MFTHPLSVIWLLYDISIGAERHKDGAGVQKQTGSLLTNNCVELLQKMRGVWLDKSTGQDKKMLWVVASLWFSSFLRSGKITIPSDRVFDETQHMTFWDVAVDSLASPTILQVKVYTGWVMIDYLIVRGPEPGPLFLFADRRPLTRPRFMEKIRAALWKQALMLVIAMRCSHQSNERDQ